MRIGCDGAEVIDRDDLDILAPGLVRRAQGHPAGAAKAVDGNSCRHGSSFRFNLPTETEYPATPML
jgi:hypothetical protein